ncbi:MAG: carbon-nitrogen hydrolase family protein [Ruminococcaceae bacterium]|nr:carbon-nitrogen hydrolase family protein [Oscillospiraceae bacterium]
MDTKWNVIEKNDSVIVEENAGKLLLRMNSDVWSHINLVSNYFDCEQNKIYKINIDADGGKTDFRTLVQFFNKNDLPLYEAGGHIREENYGYRMYVKSGEEVCAPEGMDCFSVSVVVCSDKKEEISLGDVTYEYVKDYQPKNVRICAIGDDVMPREALGSQYDLTMAYCKKIDEIVAKEKPDLIVLTEHFHNMAVRNLTLENRFLPPDSEIIKLISDKAKQHGIYICGSYHILENGCRYNRAILFDRQGKNIAQYDKTHLTIMEYEWGIKRGNEIVCVDTDIGRIGFMICWDVFFPEISRMYFVKGCDILVLPTRGNARCQNNAAAFTSASYIVAAAYAPDTTCIFDKNGDVVDEAGERGYTIATVDINKPRWRARLSVGLYYGEGKDVFMNERRPDIYDVLSETEKK